MSMQYPALPKAAGEAAMRGLLDTVRPGGLLLAVYHDLDDEHREHVKSRGVDPANYVGADDIGRLLGDDFTVERHVVEPRIDPPPGRSAGRATTGYGADTPGPNRATGSVAEFVQFCAGGACGILRSCPGS